MTAHTHVCPQCGYDLTLNAPVLIDRWSMIGPGYPLCYDNKPIALTKFESELCYALMKAYPRYVERWALLDRLGSEAETGHNMLSVYKTRIHSRLADLGLPLPIETVRGYGFRWTAS